MGGDTSGVAMAGSGEAVGPWQVQQYRQRGQGSSSNTRVPRKQCFGTSKTVSKGGTDWAAPVDVFVSNTSPDITEDDIKEYGKPSTQILKWFHEDEERLKYQVMFSLGFGPSAEPPHPLPLELGPP